MKPLDSFIEQAGSIFGVRPSHILGRSRAFRVVIARQAIAWAWRKHEPPMPFKAIGKELGGRHHTTIMDAVQQVEVRAEQSTRYRRQLELLLECIGKV